MALARVEYRGPSGTDGPTSSPGARGPRPAIFLARASPPTSPRHPRPKPPSSKFTDYQENGYFAKKPNTLSASPAPYIKSPTSHPPAWKFLFDFSLYIERRSSADTRRSCHQIRHTLTYTCHTLRPSEKFNHFVHIIHNIHFIHFSESKKNLKKCMYPRKATKNTS